MRRYNASGRKQVLANDEIRPIWAATGKIIRNADTENPGGRPKSKELRTLGRTYTADTVKVPARLAPNAKGEMTRVVAAILELWTGVWSADTGPRCCHGGYAAESAEVVLMPDERRLHWIGSLSGLKLKRASVM